MDILNKEYTKYSKPMFFNFGRIIVYLAALIIILGIYSRMNESQFIYINFFVFIFLTIVFVTYDAFIGIKKQKSYKSHLVKFVEDHIIFIDHRGTFKIPYSDIKSYQYIGDQITIRVRGNRFLISGRQHGINLDEVKAMSGYLKSMNVPSKTGLGFIYFIALFLIINYGSDYLFIQVFNLSSDASLFGTLYLCVVLGIGYFIWEAISAMKFKVKE